MTAPTIAEKQPIPMVLFCPACGEQHIDKANWESPPHRTHLCQVCGHLWRPASVYTEGVAEVPLGTSDTRPAIRGRATLEAQPAMLAVIEAARKAVDIYQSALLINALDKYDAALPPAPEETP